MLSTHTLEAGILADDGFTHQLEHDVGLAVVPDPAIDSVDDARHWASRVEVGDFRRTCRLLAVDHGGVQTVFGRRQPQFFADCHDAINVSWKWSHRRVQTASASVLDVLQFVCCYGFFWLHSEGDHHD
ncbi:hypothetical protein D3C71_1031530 [compost metagenome]